MPPRDRSGPGGPRDGEDGHVAPVGACSGTVPRGGHVAVVVVKVTKPILGRGLCLATVRVDKGSKKKRRRVSFGSTVLSGTWRQRGQSRPGREAHRTFLDGKSVSGRQHRQFGQLLNLPTMWALMLAAKCCSGTGK